MIRRFLAPALLLTLAACASDHPRGHGGGGPGGPGGPPRARLFISPSGEPFRGEDGLGRWLAQADTNHDGAVTLAEFRADAEHSFKFLDTNGDGVIDGFEMQHYEREIVPEIGVMTFDEAPAAKARPSGGGGRSGGGRGGRGGGMGGGGHGGGRGGGSGSDENSSALAQQQSTRVPAAGREGAARYSLINEPEPIAAADANLDGKVTLAEWMAITDRRFARLDHDKSGRLTKESLLKIQPKPPKAP
jgi:Ca2+-binding EF-hand superfamily protein